MTPSNLLKAAIAAFTITVCAVLPARAQSTEADFRFLHEITEVINFVRPETAREAHAKCLALSKRLKGMTGVSAVQRLYFEAEIENCMSYAMNNGDFSDETGDQCSHHYAFATKLAQVIKDGRGPQGIDPYLMGEFANRLKTATSMGPATGCTSDYSILAPAIAMAEEEAKRPPPDPPFKLWEDISAAARAITPDNAREIHKACLDFSAQIAAKPDLPAAERLLYEGSVEDCVARAMATGNYSDETGNVCDHHFRFAQKYAEGAAAGKNDPRFTEMIVPVMKGELEIAKRQGPQMGCKQDYASLKGE
ncbi:MAG: hypothetical protein ACKVP5_18090 [Aestuariivirga sp.]